MDTSRLVVKPSGELEIRKVEFKDQGEVEG